VVSPIHSALSGDAAEAVNAMLLSVYDLPVVVSVRTIVQLPLATFCKDTDTVSPAFQATVGIGNIVSGAALVGVMISYQGLTTSVIADVVEDHVGVTLTPAWIRYPLPKPSTPTHSAIVHCPIPPMLSDWQVED
jgi:hypothetical protein